jgi:hypothetical protein
LSPLKIPGGTATGALSPTQVGGLKKGNESATKPSAAAETATVLFGDTARHEAPKFPTPQMVSALLDGTYTLSSLANPLSLLRHS